MSYKLRAQRAQALERSISHAREQHSPLELLVRTAPGMKGRAARELDKVGRVRHVFTHIPYVSVLVDAADAQSIRERTKKSGYKVFSKMLTDVDVSSRVSLPTVTRSSAKTSAGLWNLENIGAYRAQRYSLGESVKVGIIDTGVDYTHPELEARFGSTKGYNFVQDDMPMDDNGHGTHVAGIVAAERHGIAPRTELYSLKVLGSDGYGSEASSIAAIEWAVEHDIDIINMSLGSPDASRAFEEMCYFAAGEGMLLVAAAGNNGFGPNYPAAFDEAVIAVAAVDKYNEHPDFSNIWETNDIAAPGVGITSTYPGGQETLTGTSMSSPHVAGVAALGISYGLSELEDSLKHTALHLGDEDVFGAGLVQADKMLVEGARTPAYLRTLEKVIARVW